MRRALILSVAIHGALLGLVLLALAVPRPYESAPEEAVMVDVVTPSEVPQPAPKPQETADSQKPQSSSEQGAPPAPQPAAPQPAVPQTTPPPSQTAPPPQPVMAGFLDPAGTLAMYNLRVPSSQFDSKAETQANLTTDEIANFKTRLRKCWRPPAELAHTSGTRVVIRVSLAPDGALASEPMLIEASAARDGPYVMRAALQAIAECQPFGFLPRDRYQEWKQLDVSFSAREMSGS